MYDIDGILPVASLLKHLQVNPAFVTFIADRLILPIPAAVDVDTSETTTFGVPVMAASNDTGTSV